VRKLPVAAAISAALHTAAIAWVALRPPKPLAPSRLTPASAGPTGTPADHQDLTEIVLLDDHTLPAARASAATDLPAASRATQREVSRPGQARIATGTAGVPGRGSTGELPAGKTGHSGLMDMRGGEKPGIGTGLSGDFVTEFLARSRPLEHGPEPTGELRPSGNGTYESKHGAFTAHVRRDGTVSLHDQPDFKLELGPNGQIARMNFDDWLMRRHGIDPYAATKLHWLDRTRDERVAIGRAYRKDVLSRASEYMQQNLAWMWARITDPEARKRALFEMWDDIAETGDDDLVKAGIAARTYLVGFVKGHLPPGSPGAFTSEELARLNAHRSSTAVFAPYD